MPRRAALVEERVTMRDDDALAIGAVRARLDGRGDLRGFMNDYS